MGPEIPSSESSPAWRGPSRSGPRGGRWTSAVVALALLLVLGVEVQARHRPADASSYHERLRESARTGVPYSVGEWLGRDVEAPPAAVELLHPNALVNRDFVNLRTGESASLLFVQCTDARDLLGHYPPICYPAHGKTLTGSAIRRWTVAGERIEGVRYRFTQSGVGDRSDFVVDDFMVLPTGEYGRDMKAVDRVARDVRWRHFGAAQVQVLTDAAMSDARRDEVFRALVESIVPLFRSLALGSEESRSGGSESVGASQSVETEKGRERD